MSNKNAHRMNRKLYLKPESICLDIDAEDTIIATSNPNTEKVGETVKNDGLESKKRVFGWDDYEYDSFGNNN